MGNQIITLAGTGFEQKGAAAFAMQA